MKRTTILLLGGLALLLGGCTGLVGGSGAACSGSTVEDAFLSGVGAPAASLGEDGDVYLDTATNTVYVKEDGLGRTREATFLTLARPPSRASTSSTTRKSPSTGTSSSASNSSGSGSKATSSALTASTSKSTAGATYTITIPSTTTTRQERGVSSAMATTSKSPSITGSTWPRRHITSSGPPGST